MSAGWGGGVAGTAAAVILAAAACGPVTGDGVLAPGGCGPGAARDGAMPSPACSSEPSVSPTMWPIDEVTALAAAAAVGRDDLELIVRDAAPSPAYVFRGADRLVVVDGASGVAVAWFEMQPDIIPPDGGAPAWSPPPAPGPNPGGSVQPGGRLRVVVPRLDRDAAIAVALERAVELTGDARQRLIAGELGLSLIDDTLTVAWSVSTGRPEPDAAGSVAWAFGTVMVVDAVTGEVTVDKAP